MKSEINVYFDTEFNELQKNCNLISIGLVTDNDDYFYAELGDYDKDNLNDWVKENVIKNLIYNKYMGGIKAFINTNIKHYPNCTEIYGTKDKIIKRDISLLLFQWLNEISMNGKLDIKLISDVCHYDMVLFADIFGGAMSMPKFIAPACYDINQDIAKYLNISQKEAFDISREDFYQNSTNKKIENMFNNKHNSGYDACIIRSIYNLINK